MLQDIAPHRVDNRYAAPAPSPEDFALVYRGDAVRAEVRDGLLCLPTLGSLPEALASLQFAYAFTLDGTHCFYADAGTDCPEEGFLPSREYRVMAPQELAFVCAVGESLHRWRRNNQFCGCCGGRMDASQTERAAVCPACGLTVYPKICPAVIVAVTDGDRLLLTKYRGRAFKRYALVAGFNEIGESIEDTVRREVMEETGLRVGNLRFYKSQPWVVTDSLLMGFFCDLEGEDRVCLQEDELSEAAWFSREELPEDHSNISLTGEMIELFRRGGEPR